MISRPRRSARWTTTRRVPRPPPLKVAEGSFRVMSETTYFRRTLVRVLIVQALTLMVLGWLHWTFGR